MRILFSYGLVGRGGDAVQVLSLAEAFRSLGHDVELVGPHTLRPYEFASTRVRSWLRRWPWWARDCIELGLQARMLARAQRLLQQQSFDIVLHRAGIYDFVGPRLAQRSTGPLVVHLDAPFAVERAFRREGYFAGLHRRCMRRIGQSARLIVTVSKAAQDYYAQLGLPPQKILVLPNGISTRLLHRGDELARAHPPSANPRTIGFVGSLSRWHRIGLLLEALRLLNLEERGCWRLQVVGYGEEYEGLRAQAKALGLQSQVGWLGALPHEQAFEQIAQFDIAVLPHTLPTGAPMKLFEYAAVARPTIAPDLPNLRQLFSEDEIHFVQPESPQALAKALLELRCDPTAARRLGKRARARVREYTWERIAARVLEALQA